MAEAATSTGADDANFGNAETIPANAKYIANFSGDEIDGVFYDEGDTIPKAGKPMPDAGTMRYLVQIGRVTEKSADDSDATSTGKSRANPMDPQGKPTPPPSEAEAFIARNVSDISDKEIADLSPELKADIIAAEKDREKPRTTLLDRLQA